MAPWTFSVNFLYHTQCIFITLMFTTGEDKNLELLTRGPMPRHLVSVYGKALYYLANLLT
jgi:hypothetical protein